MNKKIEKAIEKLVEMYAKIENDLLVMIASHFSMYDEFMNSDYWRIKKLEEMGLFNQEVIDYLAKSTKTTNAEIKRALNQIGIDATNLDKLNKAFENGKLKINPSILANNYTIENMVNLAYNELSGHFIELSTKIEKSVREAYLNVVEQAYLKTSMGTHSYQEAIHESINDLSNQGIRTLVYKTTDEYGNVVGIRAYDIESAVRRDVLTASRQLANNVSMEVAEELECEYIYLSEHLRCRPTHFDWQGTIIKRADLINITRYGEVDGLSGINCQHYFEPYFGDERGDELKKFGKEECTKAYNLSQKQRYLERGIRKWKRKGEMFKANDDKDAYSKCQDKILEWQRRTQEFTKENKLNRDFTREYVSTNNNYKIFEDNPIIDDFKNLNNGVEHLIIYDVNTDKKLLQVTSDSNKSVGSYKALMKFQLSKPNSLLAVHNHPSNSSFSFTDIETFNNYKSINMIVVKTDKYLYYLEKNGISKIKMKGMKGIYDSLYLENVSKYGKNVETRHITNKMFIEKIGWKYGRKKY